MLFGIIGITIIFSPYFAMLIYFTYKAIKHKLCEVKLVSALAAVTIVFIFAIAYNSGNLLNALGFTVYFALLFALLFESEGE